MFPEVITAVGPVTPDEIATLVDRVPFLSEGYALVLPVSARS